MHQGQIKRAWSIIFVSVHAWSGKQTSTIFVRENGKLLHGIYNQRMSIKHLEWCYLAISAMLSREW